MANGDTSVLKGRDQALRVASVAGAKPTNETTGSVRLLGDTQFELTSKNNETKEDVRGATNLISINGTSDLTLSISYSSLLVDAAYQSLKAAHVSKSSIWIAKEIVGGKDYSGLWNVVEFKETVGLDESVKSSMSLSAAGPITFHNPVSALTTT